MADKKSKIPSLDEFGKYVGKLFGDIKNSVKEIVQDYQKSHPDDESKPDKSTSTSAKKTTTEAKTEKPAKKTTTKTASKKPASKKTES